MPKGESEVIMTREQAINILKPKGNGQDDIKAAFREQALRYHPDRNEHGLELMKLINLAFEFLKKNQGKWDVNHGSNDTPLTEQLQAVFDKFKRFPGLKVELCGTWLWVGGETKRYKTELKEAGLKWSRNKVKWYWSPPGYRKMNKKKFSMDQIRYSFGSMNLNSEELSQVAV